MQLDHIPKKTFIFILAYVTPAAGHNLNKLGRGVLCDATYQISTFYALWFQTRREHRGSVVECLTRDQGAAGSSLTGVTALRSLSNTHLS